MSLNKFFSSTINLNPSFILFYLIYRYYIHFNSYLNYSALDVIHFKLMDNEV
jgi:hypothetical protein